AGRSFMMLTRYVVSASLMVAISFFPVAGANAGIVMRYIKSAADCGDSLKASAKGLSDGMVEYTLRFNPEQVHINGQKYRGRISAGVRLEIYSADCKLASMLLEPLRDLNELEYRFQVAHKLVENSVLLISTHVRRDDGK